MENKFSKRFEKTPDSEGTIKERPSIFINQTKEGDSDLYRLTVDNIPH